MEYCEAVDLAQRIEDLIIVIICRTEGALLRECRESLALALAQIELKEPINGDHHQ